MKKNKPGKIRVSQRQRMGRKLLVATGISVATLSLVMIIYFQFFKNETSKADEKGANTSNEIHVSMDIEKPLIAEPDTLMRAGNRYKVAQPMHLTPGYNAQ
jgi:hypothetical protein